MSDNVITSLICEYTSLVSQGEYLIREEDSLAVLEAEGESVAVILIPGIQYYTGQLMDIATLTQVAT